MLTHLFSMYCTVEETYFLIFYLKVKQGYIKELLILLSLDSIG